MDKLLVICGPTATGKTALAIDLAKKLNGELVSADSRQVYKGMDIGTGKDLKSKIQNQKSKQINVSIKNKVYSLEPFDMDGIPIWMYDVVLPDEDFSVSHYQTLAGVVIADIRKRGKLPIIVGGTGLYIKAITQGIETVDIPRNEQLRKELAGKSVNELQVLVREHPLASWDKMNHSDQNNPRRLIRKIEILLSNPPNLPNPPNPSNILVLGLKTESPLLAEKVTHRVEERVKAGVIGEVQRLLQSGYSWDLAAMNTFGYKEWKLYSESPSEEQKQIAIQNWIKDEIQYVKRQMTWFKGQNGIAWFDISSPDYPNNVIDRAKLWYTST